MNDDAKYYANIQNVISSSKVLTSNIVYSIEGYYDVDSIYAPYTSYNYNKSIGSSVIRALESDFANDPGDIRPNKEFIANVIGKNNLWKDTTVDGIKLNYGYMDGDPTKTRAIELGDAPVHGLMVGATGAGKSALANHLIACLTQRYSPEWLELVLVDFKNAEFPMYASPNALPHARLISGTKDGEYAISVFDYLIFEMNERVKLMKPYKLNHVRDYNKLILKGEIKAPIIPRILFYVDEFTVIFNEVPPKVVGIIEQRITSLSTLARFVGIHMLFQTQYFSGTINKNVMDQFTLRVALRSSATNSEMIMGSKLPSLLPKRGQCYTNESMGADQLTTKRWVIPYIAPEKGEIKEYKSNLVKWCEGGLDGKKYLNRNPPFYDESEIFDLSKLESTYNAQPRLTGNPSLFTSADELTSFTRTLILGERSYFEPRTTIQNNFIFAKDSGENLFVSASERGDLLNLVNTFILQFTLKQFTFIANCQDLDNCNLLNLSSKVSLDLQYFLNRDLPAKDIYEAINDIYLDRNSSPSEDYPLIWVLLINWEDMLQIGISANNRLVESFKELMLHSPKCGIHFALFTKSPKVISDFLIPCKHRVCAQMGDSRDYMAVLGDEPKIAEKFAIYKKGTTQYKFKIYCSQLFGSITAKELII